MEISDDIYDVLRGNFPEVDGTKLYKEFNGLLDKKQLEVTDAFRDMGFSTGLIAAFATLSSRLGETMAYPIFHFPNVNLQDIISRVTSSEIMQTPIPLGLISLGEQGGRTIGQGFIGEKITKTLIEPDIKRFLKVECKIDIE